MECRVGFSEMAMLNTWQKIVQIAGQNRERRLCGENAQSKAKVEADWQKNFAKLLDTYELMVNYGRQSDK